MSIPRWDLRPESSTGRPLSNGTRFRLRRITPLLTVTLALGGCDPQLGVQAGWADAPLPAPEHVVDPVMADVGAELFRRNCVACHSLGGGSVVG
ncbi:MAG TPA: hypothetical protein VLA43_03530, partial [Longimicrobiales bacterium]|nr:hypothetical protein [Longimicrobiales bacterium]